MKDTLTPFMDDEAKLPESTSAWTASKSLDLNDWAVIDSMIIILEPFFRYTSSDYHNEEFGIGACQHESKVCARDEG